MNLAKVIKKIHPNKEFVIRDDNLEFLDKSTPKPTKKQIDDAWLDVQKDEADLALIKTWTPKEFLNKFTQAERLAIIKFGRKDELVEDFKDLCLASGWINSNEQFLLLGMNYLVSKGLITENRKNEILL